MDVEVRVYIDEEKPLVGLQLAMSGSTGQLDFGHFGQIDLDEAAARKLIITLTAACNEKFGGTASDAERV